MKWISPEHLVLPVSQRRVGGAAEFSTGTGKLLVKRNNLNFLATQKPCQRNLNTPVAPSLSQNARRHSKGAALLQRLTEQGDHALITAVQRDQRAGIQRYPRLRGASARSAHWMSSAPGSPYCSIKSRSSTWTDSRFSYSARTRAM